MNVDKEIKEKFQNRYYAISYKDKNLYKLGEITTLDVVIGFEKYLAKQPLPDRIVLCIKLVKSMESILISMHVENLPKYDKPITTYGDNYSMYINIILAN